MPIYEVHPCAPSFLDWLKAFRYVYIFVIVEKYAQIHRQLILNREDSRFTQLAAAPNG
jgi:hypothetical protein